jgi:prophage antirepressor-like protein
MNTVKTERENDQLVPFTFENHAVRTIVVDGSPWFVAGDVCDVLGIVNARDAIADFPDTEKNTVVINDGIPGNPAKNVVNEPGLYRLIFQSRKPEAEKFKTWVFNEVLPSIRRTGG